MEAKSSVEYFLRVRSQAMWSRDSQGHTANWQQNLANNVRYHLGSVKAIGGRVHGEQPRLGTMGSQERPLVKVPPKFQQRSQNAGDPRSMGGLRRMAAMRGRTSISLQDRLFVLWMGELRDKATGSNRVRRTRMRPRCQTLNYLHCWICCCFDCICALVLPPQNKKVYNFFKTFTGTHSWSLWNFKRTWASELLDFFKKRLWNS